MGRQAESELLQVKGHEIAVSNPGKLLFPEARLTKFDLVRYYLAVAPGALRGAGGRPNVMVRYPNKIGGQFFFQKRAPTKRPHWLELATKHFPSPTTWTIRTNCGRTRSGARGGMGADS
jgi:bifunctional non-homologous end joining protein LigD